MSVPILLGTNTTQTKGKKLTSKGRVMKKVHPPGAHSGVSKQMLHDQLIKLGDMIGDGLADEPDGKWIRAEYKKICRKLGIIPKRKVNKELIDEKMRERTAQISCSECSGKLKQTRSGSMRALCLSCGSKFQLLKRKG